MVSDSLIQTVVTGKIFKFGQFNIMAPPVARPKYAVCHGKKTSPVLSPLDLHTYGEIYKHYILKNYSMKEFHVFSRI